MKRILQSLSINRKISSPFSLGKAIIAGILASLIATAVMDLLLIGILLAAGLPPFTCFMIVGNTVSEILSLSFPAGSVPLGAATHYIIGPVLGAFFGVLQRMFPAARVTTWKKSILFSILFAEVVSQPLLALPPIFLHMKIATALQWFVGSIGMHFIWGCAFGLLWVLVARQFQPMFRSPREKGFKSPNQNLI